MATITYPTWGNLQTRFMLMNDSVDAFSKKWKLTKQKRGEEAESVRNPEKRGSKAKVVSPD
jgi:hypothetical protein